MQTSPADLQVTHYLERGQGGDAPPAMQLQASMGPPRLDSDHTGEACLGEGRGARGLPGLRVMLLVLLASPRSAAHCVWQRQRQRQRQRQEKCEFAAPDCPLLPIPAS